MVLFPNIKINLGLNVERKREDGYHDISTLMVGVDWCDVLEIVSGKTDGDRLMSTGRLIDCPPEKNLVMKAVTELRKEPGIEVPPVDIYLHKNVPDGAGLGGGSSDAAFTLKGINSLFGLDLTDDRLAGIASRIGCDCPYFIYNVPMIASGRGDILCRADGLTEILSRKAIVIVKPSGVSVSTKEAYAGVTPTRWSKSIEDIIASPLNTWHGKLKNDFEPSVGLVSTRPAEIKKTLYETGAEYASMSGSGSAVYGIFEPTTVSNLDFETLFPDSAVHVGKFIF